MQPTPETSEALNELTAISDTDLLAELQDRASRVRALVPDCVGISVALLEHGVSFTLVATSDEIAVLDAIQYLFGGPCVDAAHTNEVTTFEQIDPLDEHGWQQFARATAAHTVASTLTLPIMEDERAVGTVNLYAASAHAFTGLHQAISDIFGAWAPGAVTNADLTFITRTISRQAPQKLRDDATIQMALGIIASSGDLSMDEAGHALREAARRAGTNEIGLAKTIVEFTSERGDDS